MQKSNILDAHIEPVLTTVNFLERKSSFFESKGSQTENEFGETEMTIALNSVKATIHCLHCRRRISYSCCCASGVQTQFQPL